MNTVKNALSSISKEHLESGIIDKAYKIVVTKDDNPHAADAKELFRITDIFDLESQNACLFKYFFIVAYHQRDSTQEKPFIIETRLGVDGYYKRNPNYTMDRHPTLDDCRGFMRKLAINIDFIIRLYNTLNNECTICCSKGFDLGSRAQFFVCGKYDATRSVKVCDQVMCSACVQTIISTQIQPTCIGCNSEINDVQLMNMVSENGKNYYEGAFKNHMKKAMLQRFTQEYDTVIKFIMQRNKLFDTLCRLEKYFVCEGAFKRFNPSLGGLDEIILDLILSLHRSDARREIIKTYEKDPKEGKNLLKALFTMQYYVEGQTFELSVHDPSTGKKRWRPHPESFRGNDGEYYTPRSFYTNIPVDKSEIDTSIKLIPYDNLSLVMNLVRSIEHRQIQKSKDFHEENYNITVDTVQTCCGFVHQLSMAIEQVVKSHERSWTNSLTYGDITIKRQELDNAWDEMTAQAIAIRVNDAIQELALIAHQFCLLFIFHDDDVTQMNIKIQHGLVDKVWPFIRPNAGTAETSVAISQETFHLFCPAESCQNALAKGRVKKIRGKDTADGKTTTIGKCDTCFSLYCMECHGKITQHTKEMPKQQECDQMIDDEVKIVNYVIHDKTKNETCSQDDLSTVAYFKQSTKNCPKCKAPVQKMSGCDQVCCFALVNGKPCGTVFSYETLKVITGGFIHAVDYKAHVLGRVEGLQHEVRDHGCMDDRAVIRFIKDRVFYFHGIDFADSTIKFQKLEDAAYTFGASMECMYRRVLQIVDLTLPRFDQKVILRHICKNSLTTLDEKELKFMKTHLFKEYRRQQFNNQFRLIAQEVQIIAQGFLAQAHQYCSTEKLEEFQKYIEEGSHKDLNLFGEYTARAYVNVEKLKEHYGYVFKIGRFIENAKTKTDDEIYDAQFGTSDRQKFDEIVTLQRKVRKMITSGIDDETLVSFMKKLLFLENTFGSEQIYGLRM